MSYVTRFDQVGRDDVDVAGGKGANLGELARAGLPVPPGFVLTTAAYREFVRTSEIGAEIFTLAAEHADAGPDAYDEPSACIRGLFTAAAVPGDMAAEITRAWQALGGGPVAVRSSATAEDLEGASFAGQQDTYLNVRGAPALLAAVRDCWASLWTARAMAYRARHGIDPAAVSLAVVVQEMVEADASGVMFTANPTNGHRDEVVVSAAWGLGESVVGGSVTTDDLVVDKATGRVRSRTTAAKTVMTVYTDTGTAEQPVPAEQRTQPVLDDQAAAVLAELGVRIEQHYTTPLDIEWARANGEFFVVQARPITALPEPEAQPPTDWTVPVAKDAYFRASIVEQLPDPLSPLFADLIDPSVARSLGALGRELLGRDVLREGEVGLPTINGYAYYRYSRAAFWRMLSSPAALKLLTSGGGLVGGQARWRNHSRPRYARIVRDWTGRPLGGLSDQELLDGVIELLDAGTEYYTAVQAIIPIAASSEVIFTQFYERLVRRAGDPPAATFLLGFDSAPILAEKSLYDLATWTRTHDDLTAALLATPSARAGELLHGELSPEWDQWRARFQAHLDRFGHTTYNLDFRNPTPADDPAPLFDALRFYLDGSADRTSGTDPHERQARSAAHRDEQTAAVLARLDPARRVVFARLLRWAQGSAPVREDALADIGLAWPQMRHMLTELGRRLTATGTIDRPEDVYWLHPDEVLGRTAIPEGALGQRQALWRGQRRVTPPQILPKGTMLDRLEALMPAVSQQQTGNVLRGTGASAGQVTAAARVLTGPADFGRMRPGDVLVASITTPAWTSLFTMASAVVTDIGGPLSHSSIVAREYGIPAVLGTGVATRRITDGARVLVNGDAGTVTLLDEAADPPATPPEPSSRRRPGPRVLGTSLAGALALGVAAWRKRRRPG
ncbi:MAG: PEP/pyruvate-binding domain-containing protein [Pseudonocardiaceae bacterium]